MNGIVIRLTKTSQLDGRAIVMITIAIAGMKAKKMNEELALLKNLITFRLGERGNIFLPLFPAIELSALAPSNPAVVSTPAPAPAPVVVATAPTQKVVAPVSGVQKKITPPSVVRGDFGAKMAVAVSDIGHGPLVKFRSLMADDGHGTEYWKSCRASLDEVLRDNLLQDQDWKLLVEKTKTNPFYTDRGRIDLFLTRCPSWVMHSLLFEGDNALCMMVQAIKEEDEFSRFSDYRVGFVIDCCVSVGKEAKALLTNCKHTVNRMKQLGFIGSDHWLARKVDAMKRPSTLALPAEKFGPPPMIEAVAHINGHTSMEGLIPAVEAQP